MKELKLEFSVNQLTKIVAIILFNLVSLPHLHAQDYPTVKAQKGDGIYTILRRNGLSPGEYMNEFLELNKGKIGKDNSVFVGQTYKLPIVKGEESAPAPTSTTEVKATSSSGGKSMRNSLYGDKYENFKLVDSSLKGAIFYLVSGHGGPDPGAIGHLGNSLLCEDEYAYDVTLRLSKALEERGAKVYMIIQDKKDGIRDESILKPDKDEVCYPGDAIPRNQMSRLRQRKDAVNKLYTANKGQFQRLVVIHVDSRSKGENIDVFFYHDKRSKTGSKLAWNLQQTFKEKYDYHQPNRGYHGTVSDRNLFMLKYSYPAAVFIELGNINHGRDQQRFMMENNRQALANWLCDGLVKDFNNNK
ncbi:N-acetylmuramoyl-L-alanine amidase family protein [Mangrovibacterium diazotrophicum]|uniref:N-acetylmuramoyl-L-alanine amidase n=1 Tax=Mangrovibacterium diazotrophicum TaxID=1261403 RepID=A0A419VWD7_9BACT|nr:N-acetylmuramoyl-L-alanine amidase [Mangrovibacterium diazotrophicum]RKD86421.1 N-acetylmuramoyl-L-alanine amidase [Mangrovibacterium diazotrophicum]